jgi:hypothetical protein
MPNPDTGPIIVPLSRTKIIILLLGSVGFVAIAVAVWPAVSALPDDDPWTLVGKILLAITVVFFGGCGLYAVWKFFDSAPGLIIDQQGIVDNSSGVSAGRIPWSEIKAVHVTTVEFQRFLTIEVRDPEKYIQRASFLKRQLVKLNAAYFDSPIQISALTLKIDFDELLDIVTRRLEKFRGQRLQ